MKPELKPCPFCGENDNLFVEHLEGTIIHPAYRVFCDNCGASTGYVDKANHLDNWNRRVPAEAVSDANCSECGKSAANGWALYCLACVEKFNPANVPTDHEIEMLATGFSIQHRNGLLKFARALLSTVTK